MPDPAPCECVVTHSAGLVAAEWPECMTKHDFEARDPTPGQCDDKPGCPGAGEEKKSCSVFVAHDWEGTCLGVAVVQYERPTSGGAWVDLGVDHLLQQGPGGFWVKPPCGKMRKAEVTYGGNVIWRVTVNCSNCSG